MNDQQNPEASPLAWTALPDGMPVYSSDGEDIGSVKEILADRQSDIFHGIVVRSSAFANDAMIAATAISDITSDRVTVKLTADEIRSLPPYSA